MSSRKGGFPLPKQQTPVRLTSILLVFAVLSLVFLAACQKKEKDDLEDFDLNEPVKLKIMFSTEGGFDQQYGNLLQRKFPNIEYEVLPFKQGRMTNEDFREQINTEQPDILFTRDILFEELSAEGRLMELDPVIQQDQFDISSISPAVIEQLRVSGNGKLYGLSPDFVSSAVYYNADLFRKYGVEMPTDRMSWDEVLQLAQRFPTDGNEEERIYGFKASSTTTLYDMIIGVGKTMGLTPVSSDGLHLALQSEGWRKVFESVMQAYQSGSVLLAKGSTLEEIIRNDTEIFGNKNDKFINGQVAMRIDTFSYYSKILEGRRKLNTSDSFQLGIVTVPVNPATPDTTDAALFMASIFSINNHSAHKRAAWEVVKYINGEEIAKINSRTINTSTPSRKEYAKMFDDFNIEPFYALKTTPKRWSDNHSPAELTDSLRPLVTRELQLVADGAKSLDEAIETIQTEGQQLLDAYLVKSSSQGDE